MVYYLGSECDAPLTLAWSKASPRFHVTELSECDSAFRRHFPQRCVRYLGSHAGHLRLIKPGWTPPNEYVESPALRVPTKELGAVNETIESLVCP
jgi:hypothetical protein